MNRKGKEGMEQDPPKMSAQRWAVATRQVFCCMGCQRMYKSRWGKHPHTKPKKTSK